MKRQALVVGINQYPFGDNLTTPATAAEKVSQLLEKYGDFEVHRLPTQEGVRQVDPEQVVSVEELEQAIIQLFQPKSGMIPETALLFFAGHGLQRERNGEPEGFLITSDAVPGEDDGLFSLKRLRQLLQESPVRQQIVWLDCCYSGELFNFAETDLGEYEKGRDRCFIAASREFQVAYGQEGGEYGELTGALLQALDPNNQEDGWVTNYTLVDFIEQVLKNAPQHPVKSNTGGQILLTAKQGIQGNICPYKGLAYFDFNPEDPQNAQDPNYFYGRSELTEKLGKKIRQSNVLAVLGASGSGKSSVVRAGLLYQLYLGKAIPGSDRWQIYPPFAPGEYPLRSLEQTIGVKANQLAAFVKAIPAERVVLVIDQFEEIFTECREEKERQQFIRCLMSLVERQEEATHQSKIAVVLVMRSDFQSKCDQYAKFASMIDQNLVRVTQMGEAELKEAITKPAEQVGLELDRELVTQIIKDVSGSPADLPLMQYTLTQLWEQKTLNRLTINDYTRLGGVKKALENHANAVYESLSGEEQKAAKRIFLELTRLGEKGEKTEHTRRQVYQQDLVNSQQSEELVNRVVQRLAKEKLIVTSKQELEKKQVAVVNIAHEALIRNWDKLGKWLQDNQVALQIKQGIEDAAREWRERGKLKDSAYLLQGRKLVEADNFQQSYADIIPLSGVAEEFVQASIEKRRSQRLFITSIVTAVILGLSGLAGLAWIENVNTQIRKASESSENLLASGREFDSLIQSLRTAKLLQRAVGVSSDTRMQVVTALHQAVHDVREYNRLEGHNSRVTSVSFSPNGRTIASSSEDGTIMLWDSDGTLLQTFEGHKDRVTDISFSPDGKTIASMGWDSNIILWNFDGTIIQKIKPREDNKTKDNERTSHVSVVDYNVSFSPDGKIIASSNYNNSVKLWKHDGTLIRVLNGAGEDVKFSPDGERIAAVSGVTFENNRYADTLKIWNRDGILLKTIPLRGYGARVPSNKKQLRRGRSLVFSPDGQMIATSGYDNTIEIWSRNGTLIKTLEVNEDEDGFVISVNFSPDSQTLASAQSRGTIKLWSRDGKLLKTLLGHSQPVNRVSFSPDGRKLASASDDNTIKLWSLDEKPFKTLKGHMQSVTSVDFSPDGKLIASTGNDFTAKIWNRDGRLLHDILGNMRWNYRIRFSPDGRMVVFDGGVVEFLTKDGTVISNLKIYSLGKGNDSTANQKIVGFSPDGKIINSVSVIPEVKGVKIFGMNGVVLYHIKGHSSKVGHIEISPDGKKIAFFSEDGTLKLWNRSSRLLKLLAKDDVWGLSFSPNSNFLAIANAYGTIKILQTDGKLILTLRGHNDIVTDVKFTPDGQMIASASWDGTVKIWRLDGTLIRTLRGHSIGVNSVSFSPDGKMLASAGEDKTVVLWNLDLDDLIFRSCDWLEDYFQTNLSSREDRHLCEGINLKS